MSANPAPVAIAVSWVNGTFSGHIVRLEGICVDADADLRLPGILVADIAPEAAATRFLLIDDGEPNEASVTVSRLLRAIEGRA